MQISSLIAIINAAISSFNSEANAEGTSEDSSDQINIAMNDVFLTFYKDGSQSPEWCSSIYQGYMNFDYSGDSTNYTLQIPNSGSNQYDYIVAVPQSNYFVPSFQSSPENLLTIDPSTTGECTPYVNGVEMVFYYNGITSKCQGVMLAPSSESSASFPGWDVAQVTCK